MSWLAIRPILYERNHGLDRGLAPESGNHTHRSVMQRKAWRHSKRLGLKSARLWMEGVIGRDGCGWGSRGFGEVVG